MQQALPTRRTLAAVVAPLALLSAAALAALTPSDGAGLGSSLGPVLQAVLFGAAMGLSCGLALLCLKVRHSREAIRKAEAACRAKSAFLADMSHEIRTPISAILGLAELCQCSGAPAAVSRNLDIIREAAGSLLTIVGSVLDISRIEAGKLTLEERSFEPRRLLETILEPHRLALAARNIPLTLEVAEDVPVALTGDPVRLGQVVSNLAGNAVKFTDQGRVRVRLGLAGRSPGPFPDTGVELEACVEDTGIGIAPEHADAVFEGFRQVGPRRPGSPQGAGLGLAICRELVALMGGRIWVESEPGKGSAFRFTARLRVRGACPADQPAGKVVPFCHVGGGADVRAGLRVLLVEDNSMNRHVFKQFLASLGCAVDTAQDGVEALKLLAGKPFDMVFLDVQMPVMDGLEVVRRLRAGECGPEAAGLPVIALTACAMSGDRERFLRAGMTQYLAKPLSLDALALAVQQHAPAAAPAVTPLEKPSTMNLSPR